MRAHLWVSRRCLISLWQGCSCCTSLSARTSSRTDHHKTRRSLQKLLAREPIELDKLFTQRRRIKSGRFVSFPFLLLLPDHPLTVAKAEPPRLPPFLSPLPGNKTCLGRLWPSRTTGHLPASRQNVWARRAGFWITTSGVSRSGARNWRRGGPSTKLRWDFLNLLNYNKLCVKFVRAAVIRERRVPVHRKEQKQPSCTAVYTLTCLKHWLVLQLQRLPQPISSLFY